MIGRPSLNLVLPTDQEPPGAPLRNGSIVSCSSSPGFKVLLDHPSRTSALGAPPSRTPKLGTAVLLLGLYDDEGVRAGELELLHHPLELDRIFLIEHRKRVVRQGRAAGGDKGPTRQCRQLPSHGVSPLLIDPTAHTTDPQRRAHRRNANVCLWDRKKHRS